MVKSSLKEEKNAKIKFKEKTALHLFSLPFGKGKKKIIEGVF